MARYILLSFEDNEEAEKFITAVGRGDVIFAQRNETLGAFYDNIRGVEVRAVWMKPTKFCECAVKTDLSVRGRKYGLYVHKACGRPKKGNFQHPTNLHTNVLPSQETEHLRVTEPLKPGERDIYLGVIEPRPESGKAPTGGEMRHR